MVELTSTAAEEAVDKAMPAIRAAALKAVKETGFGTVTVEFKRYIPTVAYENKGRTMQNGVPVEVEE